MKGQMYFTFVIGLLLTQACIHQKSTNTTGNHQHTSYTSLDWVGMYKGILPCADCEGVITRIQLRKDLTYSKSMQYLGKSSELFSQNGSFQWDAKGTTITLMPWKREQKEPEADDQIEVQDEFKGDDDLQEKYKVEENQLLKLDKQGNKIDGVLAQAYILKKYEFDKEIQEKYWRLLELNGKPIPVNENPVKEAHFLLRSSNNRVQGHGGCNSFSGSFEEWQGNRICFSALATTRMACPVMEYEAEFLAALQSCDNYSIKGDTLSLNQARMAPMARLVVVYFR